MSFLILFCFTLLSCQTVCNAKILHVVEDQDVNIEFLYPCDSTKVTLQHGYKTPFYDSTDMESTRMFPVNYFPINQNDTARNECSVQLTIKPISRFDEGTLILIAYKNGIMLPENPRIGLRVAYLPGKASCKLSNDYNDGEWVSLRCTARMGSFPEQILCYQNGIRLPKLISSDASIHVGEILSQVMLARLHIADYVYCCSSAIDQVKDRCECKDYLWDPLKNSPIYEITSPCPSTESMQLGSVSNPTTLGTIKYMYPPTGLDCNDSVKRAYMSWHIIIGILIMNFVFFSL